MSIKIIEFADRCQRRANVGGRHKLHKFCKNSEDCRVGQSPFKLMEYFQAAADPPYQSIDGGLAVLHRKANRLARRWWVPAALACALGGGWLTQSALAAAPTPESNTSCGGTVSRAKPTSLDPNLLNYQFSCDWGITAYTIFVNRKPSDYTTIDDYNGAPSVFEPTGIPDSKVSLVCSGTIPGDALNCNAGAGGVIPAPNVAEGSLDTTDPLCPYLPKGSPKGAKPQPGAVVELVVSDTTGAEDGPFRLFLSGKCPSPAKAGAKTPFEPTSSSKKK